MKSREFDGRLSCGLQSRDLDKVCSLTIVSLVQYMGLAWLRSHRTEKWVFFLERSTELSTVIGKRSCVIVPLLNS
jgi:hypothetical protein